MPASRSRRVLSEHVGPPSELVLTDVSHFLRRITQEHHVLIGSVIFQVPEGRDTAALLTFMNQVGVYRGIQLLTQLSSADKPASADIKDHLAYDSHCTYITKDCARDSLSSLLDGGLQDTGRRTPDVMGFKNGNRLHSCSDIDVVDIESSERTYIEYWCKIVDVCDFASSSLANIYPQNIRGLYDNE